MKSSIAYIALAALLCIFFFVALSPLASAAPFSRYERSLIPELDSRYYLGSTSPALAWLNIYTDELCIAGDCKQAWPTGSGSSFSSSSPWTIGNLVSVASTSGFTSVATGTLTTTATGLSFDNTRGVVGGAAVLSLDSSYAIPTTTRLTNHDTAFGWGNHATQGYITATNWLFNGTRLSPSTTVGIGVFASSTISHLSSTFSTSTNALIGTLTLTNDLTVANGGTGASTLTGLLQGNGTSAFTAIADSSTVGQVLRVTGASTYGWGALDLADGDAITGTLGVASGGTGITSFAAGVATWLGSGTASDLRSLTTGTTGTAGNLVFSGSPTLATPTFTGLSTLDYSTTTGASGTNLNFTNGTSTNYFITNASTTNFWGSNLATCNAASQAVTWSAGKFGCQTITSSGDGVSNWLYNGSRLSPSTTVGIGVFASSTIGGGTGTTGLTVFGNSTTTATSTNGVMIVTTTSTSLGTSSLNVYSKTSARGGSIVVEDSDGSGCTVISTLNGVISGAIASSCPPEY